MSFTTLEQFYRDYRVKNGMIPSEDVLNKGPMRLKREIRELKSLSDIAIGNELPSWNRSIRYEVDEYVYFNNNIYKSLADGNYNYQPDKYSGFWQKIDVVSLKSLLARVIALEDKVK